MLQADHDGGAVFTSDSCDTTRYLSIKMTRGLWSLRPVMYLSWQIIATSAEVTPNGGLGSGNPPPKYHELP